MQIPFRSGVAALLGPPNAGKSTLLNRLLGQKIAIVTPRPQTTRNRIMGLVQGANWQIMLLDTPGLHEAKEEMNRRMVRQALEALKDADVALFLVDAAEILTNRDRLLKHLDLLDQAGRPCPVLLALNKSDLLSPDRLASLADWCQTQYPFAACLPLSARTGAGTDQVVAAVAALLPEGPKYYPDDMLTDVSERFLAAEIVRETVFLRTRDEVPYSVAVLIDLFDESVQPLRIVASILVERDSQKGILIGRGGQMLGEIRKQAGREITRVLDRPVRLELWVKVEKNWTGKKAMLKRLGLPD